MKLLEVSNNKLGDITIKIPRAYIRHLVATNDAFEEGTLVTHTKTFSDELVRQLRSESEEGSTCVHLMLDEAIQDVIDDGAEGVNFGDEE